MIANFCWVSNMNRPPQGRLRLFLWIFAEIVSFFMTKKNILGGLLLSGSPLSFLGLSPKFYHFLYSFPSAEFIIIIYIMIISHDKDQYFFHGCNTNDFIEQYIFFVVAILISYIAQCAFWVVRWPCGQKLKSKNTRSDGKKYFWGYFSYVVLGRKL